jgi:RNA polymerase I-specific transcription initiation factor RRN7
MRERMRPVYRRALGKSRKKSIESGELHMATMRLFHAYHFNYEMVLPPLNDVLMSLQYVRELGLPSECASIWSPSVNQYAYTCFS